MKPVVLPQARVWESVFKKQNGSSVCWHKALILALGIQVDLWILDQPRLHSEAAIKQTGDCPHSGDKEIPLSCKSKATPKSSLQINHLQSEQYHLLN